MSSMGGRKGNIIKLLRDSNKKDQIPANTINGDSNIIAGRDVLVYKSTNTDKHNISTLCTTQLVYTLVKLHNDPIVVYSPQGNVIIQHNITRCLDVLLRPIASGPHIKSRYCRSKCNYPISILKCRYSATTAGISSTIQVQCPLDNQTNEYQIIAIKENNKILAIIIIAQHLRR